MGNWVGFTVHYTGGSEGNYPASSVPAKLQKWQAQHMDTAYLVGPATFERTGIGARDIAYNFAVDIYGGVWELRGWDIANGANGTPAANKDSVAVLCVLGVGEEPTGAMKNALALLYQAHLARGGRPDVYGHKDHVATGCPGDPLYNFTHNELTSYLPASTPVEEDDMFSESDRQYLLAAAEARDVNRQIQDGHVAEQVKKAVKEIIPANTGGPWEGDLSKVPLAALWAEISRRLAQTGVK